MTCGPQHDEGKVMVRCYGSNPDDLKLTATIPEVRAKCTGVGVINSWYESGYVQMIGVVQTLCKQGEEYSYEPTLDRDCSASTQVYDNDIGTVCTNEKTCQATSFMATTCEVKVKEMVIKTSRDLQADDCIHQQ